MSEWQPIETAPKDGTAILAATESDLDRIPLMAIVHLNGQGEWECLNPSGLGACHGFYPSHWMPLPDHPERPKAFNSEI